MESKAHGSVAFLLSLQLNCFKDNPYRILGFEHLLGGGDRG